MLRSVVASLEADPWKRAYLRVYRRTGRSVRGPVGVYWSRGWDQVGAGAGATSAPTAA